MFRAKADIQRLKDCSDVIEIARELGFDMKPRGDAFIDENRGIWASRKINRWGSCYNKESGDVIDMVKRWVEPSRSLTFDEACEWLERRVASRNS